MFKPIHAHEVMLTAWLKVSFKYMIMMMITYVTFYTLVLLHETVFVLSVIQRKHHRQMMDYWILNEVVYSIAHNYPSITALRVRYYTIRCYHISLTTLKPRKEEMAENASNILYMILIWLLILSGYLHLLVSKFTCRSSKLASWLPNYL